MTLRYEVLVRVVGLLPVLAAIPKVCTAQIFQTESVTSAATVESLAGQVAVLRDSQPWALDVGAQVKPQQIIVTGPDGYAKFKVSDGSTFEVFQNSRVTFRNTPGDWKDFLELLLGRVKVHIEKLGGQPNRNRVRTPTAIISVRGTTFDVIIEGEDTTLVSVEEGIVAVQHALKGGEPRLLNANEWIRVERNVPIAQKSIDRGAVLRSTLHSVEQAVYTAIYHGGSVYTPGGGGSPTGGGGVPAGGGSGGTGLPGDNSGGKNPPPKSGGGSTAPPPDAGPGAPPPPPKK